MMRRCYLNTHTLGFIHRSTLQEVSLLQGEGFQRQEKGYFVSCLSVIYLAGEFIFLYSKLSEIGLSAYTTQNNFWIASSALRWP